MRVILHSDINNFFASVESIYEPALRGKPLVVSGDCDLRHGIVLAKNYLAKSYGIATGDTVYLAKSKCPNLKVVHAHFDRYLLYSSLIRKIYNEYTAKIEPFSIDEAWLDVSEITCGKISEGEKIAYAIKEQIKNELGLTVSVGVSYNKIYAKLGSDIKKPDAVTIISEENKEIVVYPLPVRQLLMVGAQTEKKLIQYSINTIGDLARSSVDNMMYVFGKNGKMLVDYASGKCVSPVTTANNAPMIKSVGNGNTAPYDLTKPEEINGLLTVLCESVSERMRRNSVAAHTVTLTIKDSDLAISGYARSSALPIYTAKQIKQLALQIFYDNADSTKKVRALTVTCSNLTERGEDIQMNMFVDLIDLHKNELCEKTVISIRSRYGYSCIQKATVFICPALSAINPLQDNTIHPLSYKR